MEVFIENASIGAGGIIGLLGVIIGFLLNWLLQFCQRKSESKAHKLALKQEVSFCAQLANTFLTDNVMAPSYSLPVSAYKNSFPMLLRNRALSTEEIEKVMKFYVEVESLNKGIEITHEHWTSGNASAKIKMKENYERNKKKAERIKKDDGEYYSDLISIFN